MKDFPEGKMTMRLKQINAALSLLTALLLLAHIGYSVFEYLTFTYAPALTKLFSLPLTVAAGAHAVLSICAVFLLDDGRGALRYPRQNLATLLQRLTAAAFIPLLILHIKTFDLLRAGRTPVALLIAAELLFFADILTHAALSLSRALVTLGLLRSPETQKKLDRAALRVGALLFLASAAAVVRGQLIMFVF